MAPILPHPSLPRGAGIGCVFTMLTPISVFAHLMQPHPGAGPGKDEAARVQERYKQLKMMMNPGAAARTAGNRIVHNGSRGNKMTSRHQHKVQPEMQQEQVEYLNGNIRDETGSQPFFNRNQNLDQQLDQMRQQPSQTESQTFGGFDLKNLDSQSQQSEFNTDSKHQSNLNHKNDFQRNGFNIQNDEFDLELNKLDTLNFSELGEKITTQGAKIKGRKGGNVKGNIGYKIPNYEKSNQNELNPQLQNFDPFMPGAGVGAHQGFGAEKHNLNRNFQKMNGKEELALEQQYLDQEQYNNIKQEQQAQFQHLSIANRPTALPEDDEELGSGVGFPEEEEDEARFGNVEVRVPQGDVDQEQFGNVNGRVVRRAAFDETHWEPTFQYGSGGNLPDQEMSNEEDVNNGHHRVEVDRDIRNSNQQIRSENDMQDDVPVVRSGAVRDSNPGQTGTNVAQNSNAVESNTMPNINNGVAQNHQTVNTAHKLPSPRQTTDSFYLSPENMKKRQLEMNRIGMGTYEEMKDEEYDAERMQFGNDSDSTDSESDEEDISLNGNPNKHRDGDFYSQLEQIKQIKAQKQKKKQNKQTKSGKEKMKWLLSGMMERFGAAKLKKEDNPPEDWALGVRADKIGSGGDEKRNMQNKLVHKMYMGPDVEQAPDGYMEVQMDRHN